MKHREEKELRKCVKTILEASEQEIEHLSDGHTKEMVQRIRRWTENR